MCNISYAVYYYSKKEDRKYCKFLDLIEINVSNNDIIEAVGNAIMFNNFQKIVIWGIRVKYMKQKFPDIMNIFHFLREEFQHISTDILSPTIHSIN